MPMTSTEKFLAAHADTPKVHPGELVIVYRNSITLGLPRFETDRASRIEQGDALELDPSTGVSKNLTKGETDHATPLPPCAQEIMAARGRMQGVARTKRLRPPGRV